MMYILAETVSQFVIPAPSILRRLGAPTLLHDTPPVAPHSLFVQVQHRSSLTEHPWLAADLSSPSFTISFFLPTHLTPSF